MSSSRDEFKKEKLTMSGNSNTKVKYNALELVLYCKNKESGPEVSLSVSLYMARACPTNQEEKILLVDAG